VNKQRKLIERFLAEPTDFSWAELEKLLKQLGYGELSAGKTSGSRVKFAHIEYPPISLHKPHPANSLKRYQLRQLIKTLEMRGQL